jgi:hypothetical protein
MLEVCLPEVLIQEDLLHPKGCWDALYPPHHRPRVETGISYEAANLYMPYTRDFKSKSWRLIKAKTRRDSTSPRIPPAINTPLTPRSSLSQAFPAPIYWPSTQGSKEGRIGRETGAIPARKGQQNT